MVMRFYFSALIFLVACAANAALEFDSDDGAIRVSSLSSAESAYEQRLIAQGHVNPSYPCAWTAQGTDRWYCVSATNYQAYVIKTGSCDAGTTPSSDGLSCNTPCTISGQINDSSGACVCASGHDVYNGACVGQCPSNGADELLQISGPASRAGDVANQCVDSCAFTLIDEVKDSNGNNCHMSGTLLVCSYQGVPSGAHCTASSGATTTASAPTSTPPTTNNNTTTTSPTTTSPPGTVPAQSGTTTAVTSSSSSSVNSDGSVTTTTTTTTTTTNPDGSQSSSTVTGTSTTQGGNGKGVGTGSGTGTGTGSGVGDCDPTATNYVSCLLGDQTATNHTTSTATTFGEALTNFEDQFKQTPLGGLASSTGIGGTIQEGACPTVTFNLFGGTQVMDSHCTVWDGVKGSVAAIMHVIYVCVGILILLSA